MVFAQSDLHVSFQVPISTISLLVLNLQLLQLELSGLLRV